MMFTILAATFLGFAAVGWRRHTRPGPPRSHEITSDQQIVQSFTGLLEQQKSHSSKR